MITDWGISSRAGDLRIMHRSTCTLPIQTVGLRTHQPRLQTLFQRNIAHMHPSSSPIFSPWHYKAPMDEALSHSSAPSRQFVHACGCKGALKSSVPQSRGLRLRAREPLKTPLRAETPAPLAARHEHLLMVCQGRRGSWCFLCTVMASEVFVSEKLSKDIALRILHQHMRSPHCVSRFPRHAPTNHD